ncbi:MAG: hydrogenase maturation protease [Planctomycetes bacterium]|nr:hydrogenase maturation protease [Planctomycetota bacterium]
MRTGDGPQTAMKSILVLGIGNILLADEGVGVHVVREMIARAADGRLALPEDVELLDGGTAGIDLLDVLAGRRKVVVIDAVEADAAPGSVLRLTPDDLAGRPAADLSLHELGLLETLAMGEALGHPPQQVVIFGIVPKTIDAGLDLTAEAAAAVEKTVSLVAEELTR